VSDIEAMLATVGVLCVGAIMVLVCFCFVVGALLVLTHLVRTLFEVWTNKR
jgi:hypothetical protein